MTTDFSALGLAEPLLAVLAKLGFTTPTPIQAQAIPAGLDGRDVLGLAQTGTGKTLAFGLPLMQSLAGEPRRGRGRPPIALILAPTRELAVQIDQSIAPFADKLRLERTLVLGGVGKGPQVSSLRRGTDIVIATPGRLVDLMGERVARLDQVRHLVLDEADRMLDLGFARDIAKITAALPKARRTFLFSATLSGEMGALANGLLTDPVKVEIVPQGKTADRIDQHICWVPTGDKRRTLVHLLDAEGVERAIVFTRTKHGASRLADHLVKAGTNAEAIHGNKSQSQRQRALESFAKGKARVLVATDIAARGLDIDAVSHVFNVDLPHEPETYIHRIGRTARAGASGVAISLADPGERALLRGIEKLTGVPIPVKETAFSVEAPAQGRGPRPGGNRPANDTGSPAKRPRNNRRRNGRPAGGPGAGQPNTSKAGGVAPPRRRPRQSA